MSRQPLIEPLRPDGLYEPCIKCTICVAACPVVQVTDAFPGPKQAGPDAQRFRGRGEPVEGSWINLCTGCYRCQVACPADVPIAEINQYAKQRYAAARGRDLTTTLMTHSYLFLPLGVAFRPLANWALRLRIVRWFMEKLLGIDRRAPLPSFARRRFTRLVRGRKPETGRHRVAYFYGCFTDSNDPDVGLAVLKVLAAAGVAVEIPRQNCCGAALLGAGDLAAAQKLARTNVESLRAALAAGCEAIVVGSPSCALALSHEMRELLGLDCRDVSAKVVDLFSYLRRLDDAGELSLPLKPLPRRTAYHEACHLTALGGGANAVRVLGKIPEFSVRVLDAGCCGLAGTYGFKQKTGGLAREIGRGVAERVAEWKPELVLSECEGCRMQITALTGVAARHPVEILAEALA